MIKYVMTGLAVLGTFLGARMYVPSMSKTAFTLLTVNVSYLLIACMVVAFLSLGIVSVGRKGR